MLLAHSAIPLLILDSGLKALPSTLPRTSIEACGEGPMPFHPPRHLLAYTSLTWHDFGQRYFLLEDKNPIYFGFTWSRVKVTKVLFVENGLATDTLIIFRTIYHRPIIFHILIGRGG